MSTVTKIKGIINNYNLPVLTPQGLVPFWEGRFVNGLSEQGYTLTVTQKIAVTNFFESLMDTDLVNYIRYLWPFVGNSANVNAAKVPLIGNKLFDFGAGFTDFRFNNENEIMGITSCPAVSALNTLDFCDNHCMSVAVSLIKPDTHVHESGINRVINVDDAVQIRPLQRGSTSTQYNLYLNTTSGKTTFFATAFPDNFNDAGNMYMALGLNDRTEGAPYYNRYMKVNSGSVKMTAATDDTHVYAAPSDGDKIKTLSQQSFGIIQAMTGLVVFNKVLTKDEMTTFMDAFKAMNIALGKEVSV